MSRIAFSLFVSASVLMSAALPSQDFPLPPTVAPEAELIEIHSGEPLFEGPVWDPIHGALLFTSCRAEEILCWSPGGSTEVWLADNGGINGMVMGSDGRLLAAQVMRHGVLAIDLMTRGVEVLASDETWNQPNDVCQSPRGDIYFSDPSWADHSLSAVFRLSPGGEVTRVITDMAVPNGVIITRDGRWLIVGDSVDKIWRRYPIAEDGSIGEGELFFDPPTEDRLDPDGMARDAEGNLYLTGRGGVWVVSPEGESLGLIPTPVFCSNVGFGGADGRTLFLTGRGKVYRLQMTVEGG